MTVTSAQASPATAPLQLPATQAPVNPPPADVSDIAEIFRNADPESQKKLEDLKNEIQRAHKKAKTLNVTGTSLLGVSLANLFALIPLALQCIPPNLGFVFIPVFMTSMCTGITLRAKESALDTLIKEKEAEMTKIRSSIDSVSDMAKSVNSDATGENLIEDTDDGFVQIDGLRIQKREKLIRFLRGYDRKDGELFPERDK